MKRALLAIVGAILAIVGIGVAGTGGTLAFLSGPDGVVSADAGRISGNGYALVFNEFTVNSVGDPTTVQQFAEMSMGAAAVDGKPIFLGIAPAQEVNDYLETTARDVVSDLSDGSARVVPIPGRTVPKPPAEQDFWVSQAQGVDPKISLAKSGDDQTLVIMNADPEPVVSVDVTLGLTSTALFPVGLGLLILGTLLLVLGFWMIVKGVRGRKDRDPVDGAGTGTPPVAPFADYRPSPDQTISLTSPSTAGQGEGQPVSMPAPPPTTPAQR